MHPAAGRVIQIFEIAAGASLARGNAHPPAHSATAKSHPASTPGQSTNGSVIMAWTLLCIAGILEIAFAFGMKWSEGFTQLIPALFTAATGLSSVFLLSVALRTLPMGTGYAVWTGIGSAGAAIVGIVVLGDSVAPARVLCIGLILAGVIGLKLVPGN
jgi:quaternary ammonium compound-resistance protein SugE